MLAVPQGLMFGPSKSNPTIRSEDVELDVVVVTEEVESGSMLNEAGEEDSVNVWLFAALLAVVITISLTLIICLHQQYTHLQHLVKELKHNMSNDGLAKGFSRTMSTAWKRSWWGLPHIGWTHAKHSVNTHEEELRKQASDLRHDREALQQEKEVLQQEREAMDRQRAETRMDRVVLEEEHGKVEICKKGPSACIDEVQISAEVPTESIPIHNEDRMRTALDKYHDDHQKNDKKQLERDRGLHQIFVKGAET